MSISLMRRAIPVLLPALAMFALGGNIVAQDSNDSQDNVAAEETERQIAELVAGVALIRDEIELIRLDQARTFSAMAIGFSVLLVGAVLGVAWFLSDRNATRFAEPVTALTTAIEELTAGKRASPLPVTRDDELGQLTRSFNKLTEALQSSDTHLAAVYKTATDGIITIDTRGTIQSASNIAAEMFGYSTDELNGNNVSLLMPSPHRECHDDYLAHFLETGDAKIIDIGRELTGRRKNGEEFPIHLSVSEMRLGGDTFFIGVVSDMSRRHKAETERLNLGRILDESLNDIYVFDAHTMKFIYVNSGACKNVQYSMDELSGLTPLDLKPEYTAETFATLVAPLRSGARSKIEFETSHLRKDGTTYPVEVHLQTSRFEQHDVFVAVILDTTKRKQAEAGLRRLTKVFTDSVDAILIKDPNGIIVEVNEATERQYGWTRDELVGHSIKRLVPPEEHDQRDELMARCLRGEEVRSVEVSRITKDGRLLPVLLTLSLLADDDGQPTGIATISEDISRRKAVEEELRIKEYAIHSAVTGVVFGGLDGVITYANPSFVKMFGYEDANEVVGRRNEELASDTSLISEIMNAVKTQGYWQGEDLAKKKDGTRFPIELAVALMKNANGQPFGMVATFIDISQRKEAENSLRNQEQQLEAILNAAVDAIITIDRRGMIVNVNSTTWQLFGYTEGELLGQNVNMLMPSAYSREHDRYLADYLKTGKAHIIGIGREVVGRRKDGSTFPADLAVSEVAELGLYTGIIRDITDRKQAEEAFRREHELSENIIETTQNIVLVLDTNGRIVRFNSYTEELTGWRLDEVQGQNAIDTFVPEYDRQRFRDSFERGIRGERTIGVVHALLTSQGHEREIEWRDAALTDAEGQLIGLVCTGLDVTERRMLEREILEIAAEEQQRIGHELHDSTQQQLTGLGLLAHNVAEGLSRLTQAAEKSEALQKVVSLNHFNELLERARRVDVGLRDAAAEVNQLSRGLVPVELDAEGLRSSLTELARSVSEIQKTACSFQPDGQVEVANNFTATHLYRIAQEAVNNALKHSRADRIEIFLARRKERLTLKIVDNGDGVDDKRVNGPGMGLRIMAYRADLIGAQLTVGHAKGGGTEVTCSMSPS